MDTSSPRADESPVRDDPASAPIGDAVEAFHARGDLSFAIPAHRAGRSAVLPDAARWAGAGAFRGDPGMNHGVDTRDRAWEVQATAMRRFADAVGAEETLFSTNGSSLNVHVALLAALRPGETVAIARNGHKSAFSALVLSGARPVYVDPVYDDRWQVAHGVDPAELERVLAEHPEARAAMVFTPTYYGVAADVRALAEVAHRRDLPLITDDAWGLDFSFSERLPPSAIASGADLAIGSVHKSLNGLAQTSVLSRRGTRVDPERLRLVFELEQSTSASALLLSSIDAARSQFERDGERLLGGAIDRALALRETIASLPGLDLMGEEVLGPGALALDPTHVVFDVVGLGLTGFAAADWLRAHAGIHLELADHRRLMALVTYADDDAQVERLADALRALVAAHPPGRDGGAVAIPQLPSPAELRSETVMLPRDALLGQTEMVSPERAVGRVSAELVCPYPPGVPLAAPGELLTREVVETLKAVVAAGGIVEGAADETLQRFRVVA
jgi:arginine/lysine/ornithine decarboxylase